MFQHQLARKWQPVVLYIPGVWGEDSVWVKGGISPILLEAQASHQLVFSVETSLSYYQRKYPLHLLHTFLDCIWQFSLENWMGASSLVLGCCHFQHCFFCYTMYSQILVMLPILQSRCCPLLKAQHRGSPHTSEGRTGVAIHSCAGWVI